MHITMQYWLHTSKPINDSDRLVLLTNSVDVDGAVNVLAYAQRINFVVYINNY